MICRKCKKTVPDGPFCSMCGTKQTAQKPKKRGNGQGTVVKRGKTYTAIATVGGYATDDGRYIPIRKTKGGFSSRAAALAYIPTLMEEGIEKKRNTTFADYLKTYQEGQYQALSASKKQAYEIASRRWKSILRHPVADTTIGQLQAVLNQEATSHYTAKDMKNLLSNLYKLALADQIATVNLAQLLTLPELEEDIPEPFTQEELSKIWTAYGAGSRVMGCALLMIYTGMMPGELMQMRPEMVDWERHEIVGCGLKTKKRKSLAIVFPDFLEPVLHDLCSTKGRRGSIVAMNKDKFYKAYYDALEENGIRKLPPYSCRHTTATALALGDIAPSVIQEVMRHSRLQTTQRYIHTSRAEAAKALNTLRKA